MTKEEICQALLDKIGEEIAAIKPGDRYDNYSHSEIVKNLTNSYCRLGGKSQKNINV